MDSKIAANCFFTLSGFLLWYSSSEGLLVHSFKIAEALELDESILDAKDYDTLAGLVLDCMGSIPKAGDRCDWDGLRFEIVDMDGRRIDKVLVSRKPEDFQPESGV